MVNDPVFGERMHIPPPPDFAKPPAVVNWRHDGMRDEGDLYASDEPSPGRVRAMTLILVAVALISAIAGVLLPVSK